MSHSQTSTVWSPRRALTRVNCLLVGESTPEFRICDEKRSTILLAREQAGFRLRAGNTVADIFVGNFVCNGSEHALDSFKSLKLYLASTDADDDHVAQELAI